MVHPIYTTTEKSKTQKKDSIPALFLTGVDNLEERALKNTTIGDFVLKPFSFNILLARLEKVLSYFKSNEKSKNYKIY